MSEQENRGALIQRILTGARWATMLRVVAQVVSWASTLIVVRYVSPADYGLNAMLESPMILMMVVSTLGLETALVQTSKVELAALRSAFGFLLVLDSALFLLYFFGSSLIAAYFGEPRLDELARVLAFLFLLIPFRVVPNALLDRRLEFKLRAQVELVASVAAAAITLILAYFGAGVWALILGVVLSRALQTVILIVVRPWFVMPSFRFGQVWEMVSLGSVVTIAGIIAMLSDQLPSLIGGRKLGAEAIGVFALGAQLATIPLAKGMPILNQTLLPAFAKFQSDRTAASYYLQKLLGITAVVFFPLLVGMAAVAWIVVPTVFGPNWSGAVLPLTAMSIAMLFRTNTFLLRSALVAVGRADLSAIACAFQCAVMAIFVLIGVDHGVFGLVTAFICAEILSACMTMWCAKRVFRLGVGRLFAAYRPSLISSFLMSAAISVANVLLGHGTGWISLLISISIGAAVYVVVVRLVFRDAFDLAARVLLGGRG